MPAISMWGQKGNSPTPPNEQLMPWFIASVESHRKNISSVSLAITKTWHFIWMWIEAANHSKTNVAMTLATPLTLWQFRVGLERWLNGYSWPSREPGFHSQHLHSYSQLTVIPVPGAFSTFSWPLQAPVMHVVHRHTFRQKHPYT